MPRENSALDAVLNNRALAAQVFGTRRPNRTHIRRVASAKAGNPPSPPDFKSNTHNRYLKQLAEIQASAAVGDEIAIAARIHRLAIDSASPQSLRAFATLSMIALQSRKDHR